MSDATRHLPPLLLALALLVGCAGERAPIGSGAPDSPEATPGLAFPSTPGPPDRGPATQPIWDPATIETAPLRPSRLPGRIDLTSAQGPLLDERPISGIVAALRDSAGLRLLDIDGTWRLAPVPPSQHSVFGITDFARPAISSDGTRVAVTLEEGIRVVDATTGDEFTIPWPPEPWLASALLTAVLDRVSVEEADPRLIDGLEQQLAAVEYGPLGATYEWGLVLAWLFPDRWRQTAFLDTPAADQLSGAQGRLLAALVRNDDPW